MRALLLALLAATAAHAQGTGTLAGTVRDAATGETLPGANVLLEGTALGAATDIDGAYVVRDVPPGRYTVRVSFVGYEPLTVFDVMVKDSYRQHLDPALTTADIVEYVLLDCSFVPLVDRSPFPARVLTREDLRRLPVGR